MTKLNQCEKNSQSKCEDCVHCAVCLTLDSITNISKNKIHECTQFEDQSNFFLIPCKVGDEIYDVNFDQNNKELNCISIYKIFDVTVKGIWFAHEFTEYKDIGKRVFFSLDQARAKLRELEGNSC